jgi:hypothetical protein
VPALKSGPLTAAELRDIWEGAVDVAYRDAFVSAGEGRGFEVWTQLFAQFERASKAIDVTTQALFISPWSGQSNPPGAGPASSTVTLTFARTLRLNEALLLGAGLIFVAEETTDVGEVGPQVVRTGRRYVLTQNLYFPPGIAGPLTVTAVAEAPGYGFDNPRPKTITAISQPGSGFLNDLATMNVTSQVAAFGGVRSITNVVADNSADMFVPDHLGQIVLFTSGSNTGRVGRAVTFYSPSLPAGSGLELELLFAVSSTNAVGTFQPGEIVQIAGGTAFGRVVDDQTVSGTRRIALVLLNGAPASVAVGGTLLGKISAATATIATVDHASAFVGEVATAAWRVLDWVLDYGLTATNVLSPAGGRTGMLDELGDERGVNRSSGEIDDDYRVRVREIADVVSPNAVKRALNRALGPLAWNLREAGRALLPGFFFDGDNTVPSASPHGPLNDAYDTDVVTFTGVLTGTFSFQEQVVVEDATTFERYAEGFLGNLTVGNTVLDMIRKRSGFFPASFANVRVRGLFSGATFAPSAAAGYASAFDRHYRCWLDYGQFRGFFSVTLPRVGTGEFGWAYDATTGGLVNAYDLPSGLLFSFDGFPVGAAALYRRIFAAIDSVRAGGVDFEIAEEPPTSLAVTSIIPTHGPAT